MKSDQTKRIESYLSDELSHPEKLEFEKELIENETLQEEYILQKQIHLAVERAVIRKEVKSVGKSYHFIKKAKISIAIILVILTVFLGTAIFNSSKNKHEKFAELINVKEMVTSLKGELLLSKEAAEIFYWEGNDSIFLSKRGVLLSVPKNSFLLHGKPFRTKAVIKWEEALDAPTIMKNGLSTMTHGKLLETQGMIGINAYTKEGEKLSIDPKVGIYIQVPVDEYKPGMKLFKGVTDKDGVINWTNPQSLQKALIPVDMNLLNFYPEGYDLKLNDLQLPASKHYRDSLYLSFDKVKSLKTEETEEIVIPFEQYDGENLFKNKCSACHQVFKDDVGPKLYQVRSLWARGGAKENSIYQWVNNWKSAADADSYASSKLSFSKTSMKQFPELSQEEIDAIFDFVDSSPINMPRTQKRIYADKKAKLNQNARDPEGWDDKIKWSFSVKYDGNGGATIISKAKLIEGWHLFSMEHDPTKSNKFGYPTKIRLRGGREFSYTAMLQELKEPSIYIHKRGSFTGFSDEAVFAQKIKIKSSESFYVTGIYTFQICSKEMSLFPPNQQFTLKIKGYEGADSDDSVNRKIPPSKVLAFWIPEFNNTLLATREFERRMKEIHATGDERLLDIYTQNLTCTMEQLDQKAVDLGYPQFQQFVDEHVGGMATTKAHLKGLKKFYEKTIGEFKEVLAKNNALREKIEKAWNNHHRKSRDKERMRTRNRKEQALKEEYLLNMGQIGKQLGFDERKMKHLGKSVGFKVVEFGNFNIDRIVLEDANVRESVQFNDEKSGKNIKVVYHSLQMQVENESQYDFLFTYILPEKLNSYERILVRNGIFDYPLNDATKYDIAIVGINHNGFFYKEITDVTTEKLITVHLDKVTESELDKRIQQMNLNRGVKAPLSISEEIEWLVIEQKNVVIEKQRRDDKAFRDMLHDIIFPADPKKKQKE